MGWVIFSNELGRVLRYCDVLLRAHSEQRFKFRTQKDAELWITQFGKSKHKEVNHLIDEEQLHPQSVEKSHASSVTEGRSKNSNKRKYRGNRRRNKRK